MSPEAGWYPVALAAALDPGTSAGTRLFGQEIVVWRDTAGLSHVWEDRCPHRGMRLSFGFVRGSHIACLYHGWQFDAAGRCRFIPAHPTLDVPDTITVQRFASAERLGMVWVHSGPTEAADAPQGDNAATTPVRSITLVADEAAVLAAMEVLGSPFGPAEPVTFDKVGSLVWITAGADTIALAVQPLSDRETCLHVAIAGSAPGDRAALRSPVSRWAEALRREAEAPGVARAA